MISHIAFKFKLFEPGKLNYPQYRLLLKIIVFLASTVYVLYYSLFLLKYGSLGENMIFRGVWNKAQALVYVVFSVRVLLILPYVIIRSYKSY